MVHKRLRKTLKTFWKAKQSSAQILTYRFFSGGALPGLAASSDWEAFVALCGADGGGKGMTLVAF